MDRITRKDLKTDKFAREVGHTVEYVAEHRKQVIRYGGLGLAVLILVLGFVYWKRSQAEARQVALTRAMEFEEATIGPPGSNPAGGPTFETREAKEKGIRDAYEDLIKQYPGTKEASFAAIQLGSKAADAGDLAEARKFFEEGLKGPAEYAALAKYSLAQVASAEGKGDDAEKLLREVMASPSVLISKEQATITLAQLLAKDKPEEARKLLDPLLKDERQAVSRSAESVVAGLPPAPAQ